MNERTATTIRILEKMLAGEGRNPLPFSERYAVRNALETLRELDATAAPVVEVTDAMVERALDATFGTTPDDTPRYAAGIRKALEAALAVD